MILSTTILSLCLATATVNALAPRQANTPEPQIVDLDGPQIKYEGPWLDVSSPCDLGRSAKKSDNSLAQDVKATITFGGDVQAFGISVEANSRTEYTIETAGQTYRYNSEDNVNPGAGNSDCPAVLEHNFGTGSKVVNITLRLPRSAKRDDLVARQGFQLPSIQINRIQAFLNPVDGSNDDGSNGNGSTPDNNKNNTTPTAAGEPGSATSNHELHFFTAMILAVALAVSQGFA